MRHLKYAILSLSDQNHYDNMSTNLIDRITDYITLSKNI